MHGRDTIKLKVKTIFLFAASAAAVLGCMYVSEFENLCHGMLQYKQLKKTVVSTKGFNVITTALPNSVKSSDSSPQVRVNPATTLTHPTPHRHPLPYS